MFVGRLGKQYFLWDDILLLPTKYDKQDHQRKAAFNERSLHPTH
jgi:hypothetical protein